MVTLRKLGITLKSDFSDWSFICVSDFSCGSCKNFLLLIAPSLDSAFPYEYILFCFSCTNQKKIIDLTLQQQNLLIDKFKLIKEDGLEKNIVETINTINNLYKIIHTADQKSSIPNQNEYPLTTPKDFISIGDALIPKGYRSVAWLRNYEAEAIIKAFESKTNFELISSDGKVIFKCIYFPDNSEERTKFKSNIQAIRVNNQNQRVIGWIRIEEAQAIIESNRFKRDVDFNHLSNGNGGKIQFFPEDSSISKKYRSNTRLLRKD